MMTEIESAKLRRSLRATWAPMLAALLLAGCAPQELKSEKSGDAGAKSGPTKASDKATSAIASADADSTGILQFAAVPAPEGYKLPFPDALAATQMKETGKRGGSMIVSTIGDPKTFDPITNNESSSSDIIGCMFAGLIGYDFDEQKYYPAMLKSLTVAEDNITWTATLRDGMQWSDGAPITADDLVFTFQVIYDPEIINPGKDLLQVNGKPLKIEKVDNLTVKITTDQPTGFMHVMLGSVQPVPKHALEEAYKAGKYDTAMNISIDPAKLVVSGPFKLQAYQPAERVVLVRNDNFFRVDKEGVRLPYLDSFVFSISPDVDSMAAKFRAGQADVLDSPRPEMVAELRAAQEKENFTLYDCGPGNSVGYFWLNQKPGANDTGKEYVRKELSDAFNNVDFRKGIYHALNREALIRTVMRGLAVKADSMEPIALKDWHNPSLPQYDYDLAKAKEYLDKAGYKDSNGDGVRELPNGQPLAFTFITNVENKTRIELATAISTDLRAVGVQATPQPVEFNTLVTQLNDTFQYEACLLGFTGSIHPITSMNMWRSSGRTHAWNSLQKTPSTPWEAEVDKLADQFVGALYFAEQQATVYKMQQIFAENVPMFPLACSKIFTCVRNKYGNIRPTSLSNTSGFWNMDEIYTK